MPRSAAIPGSRGAATVAALWITLAVSTMAMSALASARLSASASLRRADHVRTLFMAHAAAMLAHAGGFQAPVIERDWPEGAVRAVRTLSDENRTVKLRCDIVSGRVRKVVDIRWKRLGGEWRVASWSEPS